MVVELDFEGVEEWDSSWKVVDEGVYPWTIAESAIKKGKDSGISYLNIAFDLDGGGRCYGMYTFSPKALGGIKRFLHVATGQEQEGAVSFDEQDLVGLTGFGIVTKERYNGKESNRMGDVLFPDEVDEARKQFSKAHKGNSSGGQFNWNV